MVPFLFHSKIDNLSTSLDAMLLAGDLSPGLVPSSEGLLHCSCGAVVGEADAPRRSKLPPYLRDTLFSPLDSLIASFWRSYLDLDFDFLRFNRAEMSSESKQKHPKHHLDFVGPREKRDSVTFVAGATRAAVRVSCSTNTVLWMIPRKQPVQRFVQLEKRLLVASLLLVVMPGAPSSVLVPSSDALCS